MIRAILFDLDGTLFDRDSAVLELVVHQYRRFAGELASIPENVYVRRVLDLDAHGHGDKTVAYRQLVSDFRLPKPLATTLTSDFWVSYRSFCRCFPEVLHVLFELRRRGFKLGLITNGAVRVKEPVIEHLGLHPLFDILLISERERVRKPSREIFHRAVRALNVRLDEACFVGDHPEVDIGGAHRAGLSTVWRRTVYWPEPSVACPKVDSLDELLSVFPMLP